MLRGMPVAWLNGVGHRPWIGAMFAILLANCVVALQYGVIFPVLPQLVELRLVEGGNATLHTGLIAATYPLALFLFAPLWGRWCDSHDGVPALVIAILCFSGTFALWFLPQSLLLLYVNRFLSGAFAAAVFPISQVIVAELAPNLQRRAQMFSWLSIALNVGYLVGPVIGGWFGELLHGAPALRATAVSLAIVALLSALLLWRFDPARYAMHSKWSSNTMSQRENIGTQWSLLSLTALTAVIIATFEVGIALKGRTEIHLSSGHLGGLMAECMLVMIVAQALVFNSSFPARHTWRLLAPCFVVVLVALPVFAGSITANSLVIATAVMAASTGILFPVISYWISLIASGRGLAFGRQTSAANLGQMLGSASVGLLANVPSASAWSFIPAVLAAFVGTFVSLGLHKKLSVTSQRAFTR